MKLSIDSLNNNESDHIDIDFYEDIPETEHFGDFISLSSPVHIGGKISRAGKNYLLDSRVDFTYFTNCSRCLKEVEKDISYSLYAYLMREDYDEGEYEDSDVFRIESTEVDLMGIILSTMSYNLPQRVLCSKDCKGICSGCGVDLNKEVCKCEDSMDDDIDPRFAKLKELLK